MRRSLLGAGVALLLAVTACFSAESATPAAPASAGPPTAFRQDAGQVEQTLASLREVDDLPRYEMTYVGAYDPMVGTEVSPAASGATSYR